MAGSNTNFLAKIDGTSYDLNSLFVLTTLTT